MQFWRRDKEIHITFQEPFSNGILDLLVSKISPFFFIWIHTGTKLTFFIQKFNSHFEIVFFTIFTFFKKIHLHKFHIFRALFFTKGFFDPVWDRIFWRSVQFYAEINSRSLFSIFSKTFSSFTLGCFFPGRFAYYNLLNICCLLVGVLNSEHQTPPPFLFVENFSLFSKTTGNSSKQTFIAKLR